MTTISSYRGEHKIWEFTVTEAGVAVNLTGAALRWVVRPAVPESAITADVTVPANANDALLVKAIGTGITVTDAVNGEFELEVVKANTNTWTPTNYVWELEMLPNGAAEYLTVQTGVWCLLGDIARA